MPPPSLRPSRTPPSRPSAPPPASSDDGLPLVVYFGAVACVAAVGSAIATIPAALRVATGLAFGVSALSVWSALAAATFPPMFVAITVLGKARQGLRAFRGESGPTNAAIALSWLALTVPAWGALGAALRATTHHHALAAVTFAIAALVVGVFLYLVSRRIVALVRPRNSLEAQLLGITVGLAIAFASAAVLLRFGRIAAHPLFSPQTRATVVDLLGCAIVALFASRPGFLRRRVLSLVGPPLAATLFILGVTAIRGSAPLRAAIRDRAPVFAPVVRLLPGPLTAEDASLSCPTEPAARALVAHRGKTCILQMVVTSASLQRPARSPRSPMCVASIRT